MKTLKISEETTRSATYTMQEGMEKTEMSKKIGNACMQNIYKSMWRNMPSSKNIRFLNNKTVTKKHQKSENSMENCPLMALPYFLAFLYHGFSKSITLMVCHHSPQDRQARPSQQHSNVHILEAKNSPIHKNKPKKN
jgi:hypothetical protein